MAMHWDCSWRYWAPRPDGAAWVWQQRKLGGGLRDGPRRSRSGWEHERATNTAGRGPGRRLRQGERGPLAGA